MGIFALFMFIICIFLLPYICKATVIKNTAYRPFYSSAVLFFFIICILLGWIGSVPVITPYYQVVKY
jgi:quinol-cytochrome oxidoreductase complex cytochrome b subunit